MHTTAVKRAILFRELHERPGILILPNPWDAGSAKLLAGIGYEALATTSAGLAFSLGKPDGESAVTREETLKNAQEIMAATHLPVSADPENGYGDTPEECAKTVLLAAGSGLAGCSIEDTTGRPEDPIYPFELAVERIRAAVKAVRSLPSPFTLTARAGNLIYGRPDPADTIRRPEAFAEAGADVLYAPGLQTVGEVDAVVRAVAPRPVNVLLGSDQVRFSLEEAAALGVKRVSPGSALARAAYGAFLQAAEGLYQKGDVSFVAKTVPYASINRLLKNSYPSD